MEGSHCMGIQEIISLIINIEAPNHVTMVMLRIE